jgi:clan AA aspartic protease
VGTFSVAIEIGDAQGRFWEQVEALADTGATYTWVGRDILDRLGVNPEFRFEFETADGRVIERDVAQTLVRVDGRQRITLVVFGDRGSRALLGAYTLEGAGLSVDPVNRRLTRVRGLAMPADLRVPAHVAI